MKKFYKFPSIESFHHKVKAGRKYFSGLMTFNIKPKLHGTNAGIVFSHNDGTTYAQSRKRLITVDDDNAGFAKFVDSLPLCTPDVSAGDVILYGEWAGQGIQKNDAITKIDRKIFAPFAVVVANPDVDEFQALSIITDPERIKAFLEVIGIANHPDVVVIDVVDEITINFSDTEDHLTAVSEKLNELVASYETEDRWVKDVFNVEGPGEGFVVTPATDDYDVFYNWSFKIKTESHTVNKSSKPAVVKAEASKDVLDFVDRFVTEPRLEQAVSELGGDDEMDMKKMGDFLKWIGQDIKKESGDELEVSELEWKNVSKVITNKARMWFMNRYK